MPIDGPDEIAVVDKIAVCALPNPAFRLLMTTLSDSAPPIRIPHIEGANVVCPAKDDGVTGAFVVQIPDPPFRPHGIAPLRLGESAVASGARWHRLRPPDNRPPSQERRECLSRWIRDTGFLSP